MLDEGNDLNLETPGPESPEGPESSNRTFYIIGGILGGVVLLTLVCFVFVIAVYLPNQKKQQAAQQASTRTVEAAKILAFTATAQASAWTRTPLPSPLASETNTPVPVTVTSSPTPVVAQPSDTPVVADAALTATMAVLQTQVAANLTTTITPQATALARTGFADEVGLPGLVILALVLVAVILLARRLRRSPAH